MTAIELRRAGALAYRQAPPDGEETGAPVLFLHGYPQSSLMWVAAIEAVAASGRRCIAPDLYGLGDSDEQPEATFEANLEALDRLHRDLGLGEVALVVHDWGGFVGLAWACEHPELVDALVISSTGFFADGKWHGMAEAMRSEQGEAIVEAIDRDGFAGLLRSQARFDDAAIDAYWSAFEHGKGRRATLAFYRSMGFEKLAPYEGGLAALGVPTLVLWGEADEFAPVAGARRFADEIPGARLVTIEGANHFVYDSAPQRAAGEVAEFLAGR